MNKCYTISEATFVIADDDDTIIGDMHVSFMKEKGCMFMPDGSLQKRLSAKELEDLKNNLLSRLESNWTDTKIELG